MLISVLLYSQKEVTRFSLDEKLKKKYLPCPLTILKSVF